ncbi:hypothetical protein [Pimelobacter simplex]|uniref:hypothetical protein n=1 Tax=Nocardioides simplex TaxID=2045 RepID=UPI003AAB5621
MWLSNLVRGVIGTEAYLFLAYAFITFRPGASPPPLMAQATTASKPVPGDWTPDEYKLFIEEARLDVAQQQADKRDIRARAQVILTTAILLGGILVASAGARSPLCVGGVVLYGIAALAIGLAALAAGGIISARSDIGTVNVAALTYYGTGELQRTLAEGYASTRITGAETIAVLVTVLRDCVAALVIGSAFLALAHLTQ